MRIAIDAHVIICILGLIMVSNSSKSLRFGKMTAIYSLITVSFYRSSSECTMLGRQRMQTGWGGRYAHKLMR